MTKKFCDNCGVEILTHPHLEFSYANIRDVDEKYIDLGFRLPDKPNQILCVSYVNKKRIELCDFCYCHAINAALEKLAEIKTSAIIETKYETA